MALNTKNILTGNNCSVVNKTHAMTQANKL